MEQIMMVRNELCFSDLAQCTGQCIFKETNCNHSFLISISVFAKIFPENPGKKYKSLLLLES